MISGNPYLKYLLVLLPFILGSVVLMSFSHDYSEVASRQQVTAGIIVRHEPSNHNRYGYTFQVNGREYSGWETPLREEPGIGQSVRVYYDPLNPAENALTDYTGRSSRMLGPAVGILIFSAVFTGVVLVLGAINKTRGNARPPAPGSKLFTNLR
jgi:uncharacterized protein DUF3592